MHLELGHQMWEPTERSHPAVASTATPGDRPTSMSRWRSASNPARSIDRYASHLPSGEYRGVLSAPGVVVTRRSPPPGPSTAYRSTFVLSATVESPCIATRMSLLSGETVTSPSP